ncbi:TrmB family transcriptional regulator [Haloferax marisrubri]|uniref:TrmB family transcriptional regulator n=1 Tax=Haloferax marisrubri TaxID=1544719 RepID=A0A2P4NR04_9EURY|nr:TrmB family transcriptional regulator sugar-binding domain-containing protein [Haloferax marisrubri]POG55563.1 TrmB family transcriptional regulator [Haloferax marisrubri]
MTIDEPTVRERLKAFGFSDKEVDTYVALLEQGEAKASDLAQRAGVSKRYVYNVLGDFEDRGLVEVNDHETPTTVRAVDPAVVVRQLTDQLSSLETQLEAIHNPDPGEDRRYEVIKSTSTVKKRIASLVQQAENEINLSVPASLLPDLAPELEQAVDRGVLTLVLANGHGGEPASTSALEGLGSVVRYWANDGPMLVCVDRTHGLFSPPEFVMGRESDRQAIGFTEDRLSPALVGSFLGNYWPLAEEVYLHEPDDLPATYERFRHAIFTATRYLKRGYTLVAEVELRATDSNEAFETRTGRVSEVTQGLVKPTTNSIPIENSFVIDDGTEQFTVGGPGAIVEPYEARRVTLDVVESDGQSVAELLSRSDVLADR